MSSTGVKLVSENLFDQEVIFWSFVILLFVILLHVIVNIVILFWLLHLLLFFGCYFVVFALILFILFIVVRDDVFCVDIFLRWAFGVFNSDFRRSKDVFYIFFRLRLRFGKVGRIIVMAVWILSRFFSEDMFSSR